MNNYDEIVPLGYVCNVTSLSDTLHKRNAAYPFDRVGTPMWAVYELIENNFTDFLNKQNIRK